MIRAEDEEPTHHRAPDSDYYSDLMSRVDDAVSVEDDVIEQGAERGSRVGAIAGWLRGGNRTHQKLSNKDEDDIEGGEVLSRKRRLRRQRRLVSHPEDSDEGSDSHADDLAAETAMAEEQVCLFPSSCTEWIMQPMVKIILVALITGLVGGIEAANAMFSVESVTTHFGLSSLEHSGLVTASIIGGTLGGLVGGTVADLYGRKFVLVITGMALLPTALTAASATTIGAVVFSRACAAAVAMATSCSAIAYVYELAPIRRRGMMPAIWGAAATSAWAAVRIASMYSPGHSMSKHGWRVVGGGPHLVLALAQLLSLCRLPESPRWLASQNRMHQAQAAIHRIHGTAFSSVSAHVIRSELASLQPSKYIMMLGAANRANAAAAAAAVNQSKNNKLSKKAARKLQRQHQVQEEKSTVASRGSYVGGEWEPAWGDGSRPCEQCISLFTDAWQTARKTYTALKRWRPVVTLLSSMCTASTGAGGLQVLYWGPKVLEPLLINPIISEILLTLSPLSAAFISLIFLYDDRNGRRPLVITGACLVVGGSLLLSVLLVVFAKLPWHGPMIGLRWLLGLPGAVGAIAASAGWQLMVISLLPLLVSEVTPTHSRSRALAMLMATSVIYAPVTLVGFDTARDNAGAIGPALLMYSCSAGFMLIFLTTVLLVETAGKEPEQILLETINRAGYVLFHMTSIFRGSKCERWTSGLSYAPVGSEYIEDNDDDDDDDDDDEDDEDEKEHEGEFGTDAKNGRVATAAGAGSLVGMIGGLSMIAINSKLKSSSDKEQRNKNTRARERRESRRVEEEKQAIAVNDSTESESSDSDEANLDDSPRPNHSQSQEVDPSPPMKQEEIQIRKLDREFEKHQIKQSDKNNSDKNLGESRAGKEEDEDKLEMFRLQLVALEAEKLSAVEAEDYTVAAAISQEIKKLQSECPGSKVLVSASGGGVSKSQESDADHAAGSPLKLPTPNNVNKASKNKQNKASGVSSYSTLPPAGPAAVPPSKRLNVPTSKAAVPAAAPNQRRVPISLGSKPAVKPQEKKQQRQAAAAMFDSMMDDF